MPEYLFVPKEPCIEVKTFLAENPDPDWRTSLDFLVEHFPQKDANGISYLIEGGAALYLLYPGQRPVPRDIDLIVTDEALVARFVNSRLFDAKTPVEWFERRRIKYVPSLCRELFANHQTVFVGGKEILILSMEILALSKIATFLNREPREQDVKDFVLLGVKEEMVQEMIIHFRMRRQ